MGKTKAWMEAFRLRTLPLAAATVLTGAIPAVQAGCFRLDVFLLVLVTSFSLQILSNLANDYGDYAKGTDNSQRLGPVRTLQGGYITATEMKRMIFVYVGISLVSGLTLLYVSMGLEQILSLLVLLALGVLAIWAAIKYTVGANAFGYHGFGDVFVFIFFGLVGVCGTTYLMSGNLDASAYVLAFTPGLLAAGVLNVNNMRDIENDTNSGKHTLVVKLGIKIAKGYHFTLVLVGLAMTGFYFFLNNLAWEYLFVFALLPLFVVHLITVARRQGRELDSQLKVLSLSSFAFALVHLVLAFLMN